MTAIDRIIEHFADLLRTRLTKGTVTTEDSVRYTFFAALLEAGHVRPEDVILEYAHPAIQRAMIDTWVTSLDGETVAVEFKYHRELPGGKNLPRPMNAGQLFHDLKRLSLIDQTGGVHTLFVYLTNPEMAKYFSNDRNGLVDFFTLEPGQDLKIDLEYFGTKAASFVKSAGGAFDTDIRGLFSCDMPNDHVLKVYKVISLCHKGAADAVNTD